MHTRGNRDNVFYAPDIYFSFAVWHLLCDSEAARLNEITNGKNRRDDERVYYHGDT